jgi:hypothetical protein
LLLLLLLFLLPRYKDLLSFGRSNIPVRFRYVSSRGVTKNLSEKLLAYTGTSKPVSEETISKFKYLESNKNGSKQYVEDIELEIIEEKSTVGKRKT